jgi:hypothetical protein
MAGSDAAVRVAAGSAVSATGNRHVTPKMPPESQASPNLGGILASEQRLVRMSIEIGSSPKCPQSALTAGFDANEGSPLGAGPRHHQE